METINRETLQADLDAFDISEELGFLLEEPLVSFIVIFSFLIKTDIFCLYGGFFVLFFLPFINQNRSDTRLGDVNNNTVHTAHTETFLFTIEDCFLFICGLFSSIWSEAH